MIFFLKKSTPSKKGLYLQIYQSFYIAGKGKRNKSYKSIGYVSDLIEKGIPDPISHFQKEVDKLNEQANSRQDVQIGDSSVSKNLGHFLLKSMLDELNIDSTLQMMSSNKKFQFKFSEFVRSMIYAQVINPGSKHNAFEKVIPNIFGCSPLSYDQILEAIHYIGDDYQKYIELFNHQIGLLWPRKTKTVTFDCTNYYFEIDIPYDDKQNGPSKEERHLPIISQALLLDEEQIPLAMTMFPGNESEKPKIRQTIEDIKTRYDINSKIIQVADKGLNCARNIYAASIEANDGYIFSKSVHGTSISKQEKEWILLDNAQNVWSDVLDKNGNVLYRHKSCIDTYEYSFVDENGKKIKFSVKEKRIVTYNPALAKKQKAQIQKQIDKAKAKISLKSALKEEFGDAIKYVNFVASTSEGEIVKAIPKLNTDKINEDLNYAGYNLIVTSETKKSVVEIYNNYHVLWRIEECFRILKTYLEARPVYLQNKESIYGHFLICYLSLTTLRLLELKVFNDVLPIGEIVNFIRSYNITQTIDGSYINNAFKSSVLNAIKERYGLSKLSNLYLTKKDVENILNSSF